jgi:hypothetical protein
MLYLFRVEKLRSADATMMGNEHIMAKIILIGNTIFSHSHRFQNIFMYIFTLKHFT